MLKDLAALSHVLGRRETVKYAAIALGAGAVAPLTGCAGSKVAFAKFAAGTWEVAYSLSYGGPTSTGLASVSRDGAWTMTWDDEAGDSSSGRWVLASGVLMLTEEVSAKFYNLRGESTARGISDDIDTDKMPIVFGWSYGGHDSEPISAQWDAKSKTLTLTREPEKEFPPITVKKVK